MHDTFFFKNRERIQVVLPPSKGMACGRRNGSQLEIITQRALYAQVTFSPTKSEFPQTGPEHVCFQKDP